MTSFAKAIGPSFSLQIETIPHRLAVIGDPITHSLSPVLQGFLIEHFELPFVYEALHVRVEDLPQLVARLRNGEFAGVNVTLPHKQTIIPYLDKLIYPADRIGAVNTVCVEEGKLLGYNTDAQGFQRSLQYAQIEVRAKEVFVLGAGGAAKAVVFALLASEVGTIYLSNRAEERARLLRASLLPHEQARIRLVDWEERERTLQAHAIELVINATSLGMAATREASPCTYFRTATTAIDLIYNPHETLFLRFAQEAGARTLNGLPMLIHQGLAAMELWSGRRLEIAEVYSGLEERLMK